MGKLIYKFFFYLQSFITRSVVDNTAQIWYRNSLLQKYFSFGRSDIDVTVVFSTNENLFNKVEAVSAHLTYCPLIKEINSYYPFSLERASSYFNVYELKKDPRLSQLITPLPAFDNEQKLTYLLRMFFANLNQSTFNSRDSEKWKFHFQLTGHKAAEKINPKTSRKELLQFFLSEEIVETLWYAAESSVKKIPLYDQYIQSPNKNILYTYMPHQFCFIEPGPEIVNEELFISQLSWEVMGVLNQPILFRKNGTGISHLKNLSKALNRNMHSPECDLKRIELKNIMEAFAQLQDQDHP
jgi:hypothetical protein